MLSLNGCTNSMIVSAQGGSRPMKAASAKSAPLPVSSVSGVSLCVALMCVKFSLCLRMYAECDTKLDCSPPSAAVLSAVVCVSDSLGCVGDAGVVRGPEAVVRLAARISANVREPARILRTHTQTAHTHAHIHTHTRAHTHTPPQLMPMRQDPYTHSSILCRAASIFSTASSILRCTCSGGSVGGCVLAAVSLRRAVLPTLLDWCSCELTVAWRCATRAALRVCLSCVSRASSSASCCSSVRSLESAACVACTGSLGRAPLLTVLFVALPAVLVRGCVLVLPRGVAVDCVGALCASGLSTRRCALRRARRVLRCSDNSLL